MEFINNPYIVYVKLSYNGYITAVNSSAFIEDTDGWIEIDSGYGDKFHHAQGNYFPESIYTCNGAYRYKLMDGKIVECTEEEIKAQEDVNISISNMPTQLDIIEAQVAYTAMMTDTLLEV